MPLTVVAVAPGDRLKSSQPLLPGSCPRGRFEDLFSTRTDRLTPQLPVGSVAPTATKELPISQPKWDCNNSEHTKGARTQSIAPLLRIPNRLCNRNTSHFKTEARLCEAYPSHWMGCHVDRDACCNPF